MAERRIARIAVSSVPYAADRLYTYLVPEPLEGLVAAGKRVTVPFGRGNRRSEGLVLELGREEDAVPLKAIGAVLDDAPLLDGNELRLVRWMKARYFCTYYDAVKAILPGGVWLRYREIWRLNDAVGAENALSSVAPDSAEETLLRAVLSAKGLERAALDELGGEKTGKTLRALEQRGLLVCETTVKRRLTDKTVRMVSLRVSAEDALAVVEPKRRSAPVRCAVVELLSREGTLSAAEIGYYTGATMQTLRGLERAGLIAFSEREELRVSEYASGAPETAVTLNDEQRAACEGLSALLGRGGGSAALLYGVTASGKTQVYLELIEETLRRGRTAMLLVPEIALTPQMLRRFTARFGADVALLHSALPLTERYDQWKRIRRGEVRVVLGTRSAVFAPLPKLGLIVLDEEQETSYRSENPPRYQARDIAQFRCAQNGALLLLGSATPTVETAYYAKHGRYQVFSLHRRYNDLPLPKVLIADLKDELRQGNETSIGRVLRAELTKNLERGEQSILFLNRRGSARLLLCGECGYVPQCPRCSVPMTYHSANGRLMCHYCGHSETAAERCCECGGLMKHVGAGTQRVEQELGALFPGTKVLRMDADTVGAARSHETLLREFEEKKVPILLGTQMVAKGLDFDNVTLVGVLDADLSLYAQNYGAAERTYSLLAQVVGRAGRGDRAGRAVIQTYHPESEVIRAAAAQDYEAFYRGELRLRRLRRYPPFAELFTLTVSGLEEHRVIAASCALRDALRASVEGGRLCPRDTEILGPAAAPVVKVNNRYRYRLYVCGTDGGALRRMVSGYLSAFYARKENRGLDIFADCNALQ